MKDFELEPIPLLKKKEQPKIESSTDVRNVSNNIISVTATNDIIEKIKDYAYWERMTQKEVILQALEQFLSNKSIKSRPDEVKNRTKVGRKRTKLR